MATFPYTPSFVHGEAFGYAVTVHRFGDLTEQRYLTSRQRGLRLSYEFARTDSGVVAGITSWFLGHGGPRDTFTAVDHRDGTAHTVRFAAPTLEHAIGPLLRKRTMRVDFVVDQGGTTPIATAYTAPVVPDFCDVVVAGSGVIFPPPGPPAPFLGEQAPEGADIFFWQSVASYEGVTGWHMTGHVRGTATTQVGVNTDLRWLALPYIFPRSATIAGLGVVVTGAGAGGEAARLSVWAARSSNNLYPGSLVADCGSVALTATGLRSVTTSVAVQPNVFYFLGFVSSGFASGAKTMRGYTYLTDGPLRLMGVGSHASGVLAPLGWTITGSMTLPTTYPNSGVLIFDQNNVPAIAVRLLE
jgi:hypothetical protein